MSVTAPSGTETLNWGDDGSLSSVTNTGGSDAGTTSYFYDADGTLIEQDGPSSKTLFLPWEELTATTSGGTTTTTGTRYYDVGGTEIAARTSAGDVSYLLGDQEGTSTLAIDSSNLDPARRYYDPFGNPVGAAVSWPGLQGFQGGTADPDTGLENSGAREYDPGAAVFTSPDPLLTPSNPQDLNPYAYAQDTPPTGEDPSGQAVLQTGGARGRRRLSRRARASRTTGMAQAAGAAPTSTGSRPAARAAAAPAVPPIRVPSRWFATCRPTAATWARSTTSPRRPFTTVTVRSPATPLPSRTSAAASTISASASTPAAARRCQPATAAPTPYTGSPTPLRAFGAGRSHRLPRLTLAIFWVY